VHPTDNFLDLGGHSLLIMRAVSKIEASTGVRLGPRAFVFQTLAQIAAEVDAGRRMPTSAGNMPAARNGGWLRRIARLLGAGGER
jgi:hypothetical protein